MLLPRRAKPPGHRSARDRHWSQFVEGKGAAKGRSHRRICTRQFEAEKVRNTLPVPDFGGDLQSSRVIRKGVVRDRNTDWDGLEEQSITRRKAKVNAINHCVPVSMSAFGLVNMHIFSLRKKLVSISKINIILLAK